MRLTLGKLRNYAIAASLGKPTTLRRAIARLGFVQADPIRSPARAQDLILRHRVKSYHTGDLEKQYAALHLEEDFVYAYGFMPATTWELLHPRLERKLTIGEQRVLELVASHRQLHPRQLEQYLGREREVNAWGGYSKATTRTLEALHYRGLLRVAGRENGIRLYEADKRTPERLPPEERLRRLTLLIANILAPVSARSLQATLRHLGRAAPDLSGRLSAVKTLLKSGELASAEVGGVLYVWPISEPLRGAADRKVRFLAPFDPIVWDRARFEHLWGWPYRFEAYTPSPKRVRGYYAMPMLWGADMVGWVNVSNRENRVIADAGFVKGRPADRFFEQEFEAELERVRTFLRPRNKINI